MLEPDDQRWIEDRPQALGLFVEQERPSRVVVDDFDVAVVKKATPQLTCIYVEVVSSQALLHDYFQQAGGAEHENVVRVARQFTCLARKSIGPANRPEQQMRVERRICELV